MHRAAAVAVLALAALVAGCDDSRDARPSPMAPARAALEGARLAVDAAGARFARLELEVEGAGMRERWTFEGGKEKPITGAIGLPAGEGYAVYARAYDAEGRLTNEGKGELRVEKEVTPQVELALAPQPGADWEWVRIGSHRVTASATRLAMRPGESAEIELGLVDADGRELPIEEGSLTFDFPGWPDGVPPIEVKYGGLKAWIAIQQMKGMGIYGHVLACVDKSDCLQIVVDDATDPIAVTAGAHVTCVLRATGSARCWGLDQNGETAESNGMSNLAGREFVSIAAGTHNHAFGTHVCAIDRQGAVWCWGLNDHGQLGNGAKGGASDVQPVPQQVSLPLAATQVAPGERHTCALLVDGSVYCWGERKLGAVGDGSYRTNTAGPVDTLLPARVATTQVFTSIGSGNAHSCGLNASGEAWCWGRNVEMQAGVATAASVQCNFQGLGMTWDHCVPTPTLVQGVSMLAKLAVGSFDSCGLTAKGEAWCWGNSWQGNPQWTPPTATPVQVQGGVTWEHLSIGGGFKCGFDTSEDGACWGANYGGQLGTGTATGTVFTPSANSIAGNQFYTSMDAGDDHACAIRRSDTRVVCWGIDNVGTVLGYAHPGVTYSATPQAVTVGY